MNKKLIACTLALSLLLLGGCSRAQVEQYIDSDLAKSTALQDAGLTLDDVDFDTIVLDKRNGMDYYQLTFTANGQEYKYNIDALTGAVIEKTAPASSQSVIPPPPSSPAPASSDASSSPLASTPPPANTAPAASSTAEVRKADAVSGATSRPASSGTAVADKNTITAETAKSKALAHAGLAADKVTFIKAELDRDDGRRVYDVEFYTDGKEYDYEIDANTGAVLSYDYDADHYTPPAASGNSITADAAKKIALGQVPGATAENIYEFETDYDDGRLAYEGKIIYDGTEYEFEIDGYSGAIRSWEVERAGW